MRCHRSVPTAYLAAHHITIVQLRVSQTGNHSHKQKHIHPLIKHRDTQTPMQTHIYMYAHIQKHLTRGVQPSDAMMHFPPVSDFPPISENFPDSVENFPNFTFSQK